jgi:SAM-dependent methyltransferase
VNSYTGLHAATYDELYADKPYAEEARIVHELVGCRAGRLLDVACGTGRHASAFAELGYDVTAVDLNEELLDIGRAARGVGVRFVVGDMRDLLVDGGPFDVVTCLFDSLGYAGDNDGVVATLRSLGRQTAPDGVIVCEFLHAAAMLCSSTETRVRRLTLQDGRSLVRTSETSIDVERMLMHVRYELTALDDEGRASRQEELQTNRFFSVPEMTLLADAAGLRVRKIGPAYRSGPIDRETFHLMLVASQAS